MAYLIGIGQPLTEDAKCPPSETTHFTPEERRALVDAFGNDSHPEVYVVEDHAGGEDYMDTAANTYEEAAQAGSQLFDLPTEKRLGRVLELILDRDWNIHPVVQLFHEKPRSREIVDEISAGKGLYGFSLGTDIAKNFGEVVSKRFAHLGLTKNPEYGSEPGQTVDPLKPGSGTWLHDGTFSHEGIDKIIATKYLSKPGTYVAKRTLERVKRFMPLVNQSIGASRPASDSTVLIGGEQTTPPPTVPATMSTPDAAKIETPAPLAETPAVVPPPQENNNDDYVRVRDAVLLAKQTNDDATAFIANLKPGNHAALEQAQALYDRLTGAINEGKLVGKRECVPYYGNIAKLSNYLEETKAQLKVLSKEIAKGNQRYEEVFQGMIEHPLDFGPILQSIMATGDAISNQRTVEAAHKEEVIQRKKFEEENVKLREENEKYKRQREADDNAKTMAPPAKRSRYDAEPAPASNGTNKEAEKPVLQTVGATRHLGSSNMPLKAHGRVVKYWDDLAYIPREQFNNSPFSKTEFSPAAAADLERIRLSAIGFGNSPKSSFVDGVVLQ